MGVVSAAYQAKVASGDLSPDPAQSEAIAELDRIATAFANRPERRGLGGFFAKKPPPIPGLYLWGGVGRGKSMLMDMFHDAVAMPEARRVHFHTFMQEVQAALHKARQTGVDDAIKPVADDMVDGLWLLCLDEMQITDIADAMIVGRLFQRIMDAGVTIVTTSNRQPDALYENGLNRALFVPFIELLKQKMAVHELVSPRDYRQNRLKGEKTYFCPADTAARQAVDRIWADLSDGTSGPLVLHIKGRQVELPLFANGVARSRFFDLCGQPLGPADYLAIADAVRILIIEDIPRLSSENYNMARRFVTLVDALYEAKVRLIATAADEPERLYIEGEGSFEFERTASRLREMQSEGWGKGMA